MKRSLDAVPFPFGVRTTTRPDTDMGGTCAVKLVADAVVTVANVPLKVTASFNAEVSKFVPVMVTLPVVSTTPGEKPVIVGAVLPTAKEAVVVLVVLPTFTEIVPLVAPAGTVVTI